MPFRVPGHGGNQRRSGGVPAKFVDLAIGSLASFRAACRLAGPHDSGFGWSQTVNLLASRKQRQVFVSPRPVGSEVSDFAGVVQTHVANSGKARSLRHSGDALVDSGFGPAKVQASIGAMVELAADSARASLVLPTFDLTGDSQPPYEDRHVEPEDTDHVLPAADPVVPGQPDPACTSSAPVIPAAILTTALPCLPARRHGASPSTSPLTPSPLQQFKNPLPQRM